METAKEHIAVKVHKTSEGEIIAACDREILGKRFKEGNVNLHINEEFYFEREIPLDELLELLEGCLTANLVGERVVRGYCEKNPHARGCVIVVGGVPHLQIYSL